MRYVSIMIGPGAQAQEIIDRQARKLNALTLRVGLAEGWLAQPSRDDIDKILEFYPLYLYDGYVRPS